MLNPLINTTLKLVLVMTFVCFAGSALAFPGGGNPGANQADAPALAPIEGTVVQAMDSGGYTYLLLDDGSERVWAAIPGSKVQIGQEVKLSPGMTMNNFTSPTLGRTFEAIIFSQGMISAK